MERTINTRIASRLGMGGYAFGDLLPKLAAQDSSLYVLSADMSSPAGLDRFKNLYPNQFVNVGIAEQNLIGVAAGMADEGNRVIATAQACFLSMRCFEQVRQYCGLMNIPLVLVGLNSGFSLTLLGATHYALEDIALMRSIPNMTIVAPADATEAAKSLETALALHQPVYLRWHGGVNLPIVYKENYEFQIGKAIRLREGNDVQLIACGSMVSVALETAQLLSEHGIQAEVLNMHTIRPLDVEAIRTDVRLIVTLEEHGVIGGLGDAIISSLATNKPNHPHILKIGATDYFSKVGNYDWLLQQHGLTAMQVAKTIQRKFLK